MSEIVAQDMSMKPLLDKMVAAKQLSATDAAILVRQSQSGAQKPLQAEADVLRWLAQEYDLTYTTLEDIDLDRQLLSLFPARLLRKEELLPLWRINGSSSSFSRSRAGNSERSWRSRSISSSVV